MQQLIYAMRFTGTAGPVSEGSNVWRAVTTSPSCAITSVIGPAGLRAELESVAGDDAQFESEVTFTSESGFQEAGTVTFGHGHSLRFSTVGEGRIGPGADPSVSHGVVSWRVDGGEGQLAGAQGFITSNFTVGGNGEVVDHHFGVLYIE